MNERIRELRRQATMTESYASHDGSVHTGKSVDLEKFAELIVRECAAMINAVPTEDISDDNADWEVIDRTLTFVEQKLKQHFGIK